MNIKILIIVYFLYNAVFNSLLSEGIIPLNNFNSSLVNEIRDILLSLFFMWISIKEKYNSIIISCAAGLVFLSGWNLLSMGVHIPEGIYLSSTIKMATYCLIIILVYSIKKLLYNGSTESIDGDSDK